RCAALTLSGGNGTKLDLADSDLIHDYAGLSPLANIQSLILTGYANGAWTGNGITSSAAAAAAGSVHRTALGYAEASNLFNSFPASFDDQSVDNTTVLVRYTYFGDANLDRTVDTIDFNLLA